MVMANGFNEISRNEMSEVNGGAGLLLGALLSWVIYEITDGICEDVSGKGVGDLVADLIS